MFESAGVAVFALTGALVAARKGMDPFGFILLATVTGVGGGTLRDLLIDLPVFWVVDPSDVLLCSLVALSMWALAFLRAGSVDGWSAKRLLLWADAAGLALFAVVGAQKALAAGTHPLVAIALGAMTASFGGILRDLLAGERALVLWSRDFYVTAAALGAATMVLVNLLGWGSFPALLAGVATGFGLRAGSMLFGWKFPELPQR